MGQAFDMATKKFLIWISIGMHSIRFHFNSLDCELSSAVIPVREGLNNLFSAYLFTTFAIVGSPKGIFALRTE